MIFPRGPHRLQLLTVLSTTAAFLLAGGQLQAEPLEDIFNRGKAHDAKFEAKEALQCYLAVEKAQPQNADILVRIARQYRHLMADTPGESEKLKLGYAAVEYGKRAAAMAPENSEAQLSCAVSYGKMVPLVSKKEQVRWSKLIKEGAETALKLDERNDTAWFILGRWNRSVAAVGTTTRALAALLYEKLPVASNEKALECMKRAIEINPHRLMHYIELGMVQAQMGHTEDARRNLEKGLAMPNADKDDPALKLAGRELLDSFR
jgi:tetratricopeptide (TPR) repeat protein